MKSVAHYRRTLKERGIGEILIGRLRWYKQRFQMDNLLIGKLVEALGNRIKLDGSTICVDNPLVSTRHKSSMFFGIYEGAERELATKYIDRSLPTVEIGGSIGGVACIVNKLLRNPKNHVVLECNPILLPTLEKNRDINSCGFVIEPFAIAYGTSEISFTVSDHFMLSGVQTAHGRKATVQTISLNAVLQKYNFRTINLISDCEGAEADLIENEADVMRERVKWLILETHEMNTGKHRVTQMLESLARLGFQTRACSRDTVLALENESLP
jgi:FkbM family methyltransferase